MPLPIALAHLTALNLIRSQAEEDYVFGHVLIQEAAYQSLLKADRRTLHHHVGEVLVKAAAEAATLAAHFREAGEVERAAQYFLQAGQAAVKNYANVEAEGHYRQAVQLLSQSPVSVEQATNLARAWAGVGRAQTYQSRFAEAESSWREALHVFERLQNWDEWAHTAAQIINAVGFGGDWARALALSKQWVQAYATQPETPGLAALLQQASAAAQRNAQQTQAWALNEQALAVAERTAALPERVYILTQRGYGLIGQGRVAEATATLTEVLHLAECANLRSPTVPIHAYLAQLQRDAQHNLPVAYAHFMQAAQLSEQMGMATRQIFNLVFAVEVAYGMGAARRGAALWQQAAVVRAQLPDPRVFVPVVSLVEVVHLSWHADWAAMQAVFQVVETETRQRHELQYLAIALWLHGYHWLIRGEGQQAQATLLEALALWQSSDTNYVGLYYNLSAAYSLLGDLPTARHWLAEGEREAPHMRPYWRDEEARLEAEALLALAEGRLPAAWAHFAATTQHLVSWGAFGFLPETWALWAWACTQQGLAPQAQQLWQCVAALRAAAAQDASAAAVTAIVQQLPVF